MNAGTALHAPDETHKGGQRRWCVHAEAPAATVPIEFRSRIENIVRDAPQERAVVVRVDPETVVVTFSAFGDSARAAHEDSFDFLEQINFPESAQLSHREASTTDAPRPFPDLIGVKEVARILGVSKQRASEIQNRPGRYPLPISRVDATPLWLLDEVRAFAAAETTRDAP